MIRHIVFFSAKNPADKEAIYEGLSTLGTIPHSIHFEVGRNMLVDTISPGGPDFIVYGEFADEAQLAAYKAHPTYAQATALVRPLRELRMAADFVAKA